MNDSYKSMDKYLEEFLLYKHSLGYSYVTHAYYLKNMFLLGKTMSLKT